MAKELFNWLEKDVAEDVLCSYMLLIGQVFHLGRMGKREKVYIMTHAVADEISLKRLYKWSCQQRKEMCLLFELLFPGR